MKVIECEQKGFLALIKSYEANNLDIDFKINDYVETDKKEQQAGRFTDQLAKGDLALPVSNAELVRSVNDCVRSNWSNECVTRGLSLPALSKLLRETGYEISQCKFEVSLWVNCGIAFSTWKWWHYFTIWNWWGYSSAVPACDFLSKVKVL